MSSKLCLHRARTWWPRKWIACRCMTNVHRGLCGGGVEDATFATRAMPTILKIQKIFGSVCGQCRVSVRLPQSGTIKYGNLGETTLTPHKSSAWLLVRILGFVLTMPGGAHTKDDQVQCGSIISLGPIKPG